MRLLVLSDMHGRRHRFEEAVLSQPEAKDILFLGDGAESAGELAAFFPDRTFHIVSGNCDFSSNYPTTKQLSFGGVRLLATHGHTFSVKSGTERLLAAAEGIGAQIACYGHTHIPNISYQNGIYFICPGSLCGSGGSAGYAVIDITDVGIMPILIRL